jgi:hypothetical protein
MRLMNLRRLLKGAVIVAVCYSLSLPTVRGQAIQKPPRADPRAGTMDLTREQLLDHIRGGWTGMLIGGIEGLAHEFKYIAEPRASLPDYPLLPDGARTDDDNDFEWTHLWFMDREGAMKIPSPRITACAVVGQRVGYATIAKLPEFHMPDRYVNHTRPQLPRECKVSEQAELMLRLCEKLILANGGQRLSVGTQEAYRIRLQVPAMHN